MVERNRPDDTFGFGVVFSDATLDNFAGAPTPRPTPRSRGAFAHWDDIDVHYRGQVVTSTGHGFSGLSRQRAARHPASGARPQLGVQSRSSRPRSTDVAAWADADLVLGRRRREQHGAPALRRRVPPAIDWRREPLRLARHDVPVPGVHLLLQGGRARPVARPRLPLRRPPLDLHRRDHRGHVAPRRAGRGRARTTPCAFCEALFARRARRPPAAEEPLALAQLPHRDATSAGTTTTWCCVGDAAHTAHFSIGSGTKLAMEDAIALSRGARGAAPTSAAALAAYEAERRPEVEALAAGRADEPGVVRADASATTAGSSRCSSRSAC